MGSYLPSILKQFSYYKLLGEKTFSQLSDEQLQWQHSPESNSIAIIVKHLAGNMKSRWTDFLESDGEKSWRQREAEFEATISSRAELLKRWEEGWQVLFDALNGLQAKDQERIVYIRNQGHTVTEAINRQLAHYAYHVGQIVLIGKMLRDTDWESLSVPKGQSAAYNQAKFAQERKRGHFTDELLPDKE